MATTRGVARWWSSSMASGGCGVVLLRSVLGTSFGGGHQAASSFWPAGLGSGIPTTTTTAGSGFAGKKWTVGWWLAARGRSGGVDHGGEASAAAAEKLRVILLGQPNVGKSTLFNRLTTKSGRKGSGRKTAITMNTPGGHVTRDVIEGKGTLGDLRFHVFDTAGHNDERFWQSLEDTPLLENNLGSIVRDTLRRSHVALFVVDGRHGLSEPDFALARWLRRNASEEMMREGRVRVVLNKCEGLFSRDFLGEIDATNAEACSLGFGEGVSISAETGEGMSDLYHALRISFPASLEAGAAETHGRSIRVAITGRPNVGKSTLMNRILGFDRVLTGPKPGLTRDSVEADCAWEGRQFTVVDTAGRVRSSKFEHYDDLGGQVAGQANEEAERAVHFAHIVVLLVDVSKLLAGGTALSSYLTHFEATIAANALRHGRPLIVLANKMDLVDGKSPEEREIVNKFLNEGLQNYQGVKCIPVSAKTGLGMGFLFPAVAETYDKWQDRIQTSHLNDWLQDLKHFHHGGGPTSILNSVRYVTQVKARPPTFAFFLSGSKKKKENVPNSVAKFLVGAIQNSFGLEGIPVRVLFR
ncbi:ribosome-associated GTPase [Chloropicon primus]|uniref:GTPase Der n=1 Tax=Chloropicon primus TaxID=1764295 RepID=A0A5B8MHT5_9CHLO|nr:ribosome-associated GTPase [Chloropicon primus]|eukprot:QDZ19841.1 ribosome-associated GTPase [Chloropicon primus]